MKADDRISTWIGDALLGHGAVRGVASVGDALRRVREPEPAYVPSATPTPSPSKVGERLFEDKAEADRYRQVHNWAAGQDRPFTSADLRSQGYSKGQARTYINWLKADGHLDDLGKDFYQISKEAPEGHEKVSADGGDVYRETSTRFLHYFPDQVKDEVYIEPSRKSRPADEKLANTAAGYDKTPDGYTWHHHQEYGRMQLVPRDLHEGVHHIGGWSIWGKP